MDISEPFDLTNTARSVYDNVIFEQIKSVFVRSCRTLHDSMDLNSLFDQPFMQPTSSSPLGGGGVGGHVLATMAAAASSAANATKPISTASSSATDASSSSITSTLSSADTSSWGMFLFVVFNVVRCRHLVRSTVSCFRIVIYEHTRTAMSASQTSQSQ